MQIVSWFLRWTTRPCLASGRPPLIPRLRGVAGGHERFAERFATMGKRSPSTARSVAAAGFSADETRRLVIAELGAPAGGAALKRRRAQRAGSAWP
jgi:hypothetical protein